MGIKIGNNNKIKNSNFINNSSESLKEKNDFWKSVFVNLTSNFIWWIIGIIAIAILPVIILFKDNIINIFK